MIAGINKGEADILDIQYTDLDMEDTEPETAEMLHRNKVNLAKVESNSGGRGFARNVKRLLWETHTDRNVDVSWFHQSENKIARILVGATFIMNHFYFLADWKTRFPGYHNSMTTYHAKGKNKFSDAPDATTGLSEMINLPIQEDQEVYNNKDELGIF